MAKSRAKKDRSNERNNKRRKLGLKPTKKTHGNPNPKHDPLSDEEIQRLLDPYSKDQLIGFLLDAAASDPSLLSRIRTIADSDVSHRKIFVHGLSWDTTTPTLLETFRPYGEIEDCNVVVDKSTGRSKGYGFVLFHNRSGAVNALKDPQKKIGNRITNSQLASIGPVQADENRRVYVSNVHADVPPDKLKAFFARFGEIEAGPFGYDLNTGKSRGYALFIYKTLDAAAKALEEPYKMFEGHQLHCKKAMNPSKKGNVGASALMPAATLGAAQVQQQPMMAAVAAAQNLALYSQNPAYAMLLGQNPLLAAAALNPVAAAAALNPAAVAALGQASGMVTPQGQQYGMAGIGSGSPSVIGAYGLQSSSSLPGNQSYQGSQLGNSSLMRPGSSFGGYNSYICSNIMSSAAAQFATSRMMAIYEPSHQISLWGDSLKADSIQNTGLSAIVEADTKIDHRLEDISHETLRPSKKYDQEANKSSEKVLRRLAQNREAARKSRLRKKAYVQQLESSRLKLAQLENEVGRARQQGVCVGGNAGDSTLGLSEYVNSGIAAFEMEYGRWVEEQDRQTCELRSALQAHVSDIELHMLVEGALGHYDDLFRIKASAANSDAFHLMSGMWKTAAERFFLWIGGFRPSELLKILSPQLDPLSEPQLVAVYNLKQSSRQAEDALSQGLNKLQQTLSETLISDRTLGAADYMGQMGNAMRKLEALVSFVNQADHLRQQTLQQMYKILTTHQAARGLLALGDYLQRLRALSSLWAARHREPA